MRACFDRAGERGLIAQRPEGAVDATGLEARHASSYYVDRKGYRPFQRRKWPKLTVVCHTASHLLAGVVVTQGPSNDSPQFPEALRQAVANVPFDRLLADAAYDAEHNHRLCREELGIRSTVIPLNDRAAIGPPATRYRAQMARRFPRRIYDRERHQSQQTALRLRSAGVHRPDPSARMSGPRLDPQSDDPQIVAIQVFNRASP